jgi:nucleotide-binding universal stress UspA family protein
MTMRVLLATDGSDDARMASTWLGQLPLPAGSRLRVVSAVSIPPSALDIPSVHDFIDSLREQARQAAETVRMQLAPRFAESEAVVVEGDAREAILNVADTWPADLIVLGARGLGAVAGLLLGSVSLGVARHARCSVLVVKPGAGAARGIVIGIDGSPHAVAAVRFVAGLRLDPTAVVRLVGAVEPPPMPATTPRLIRGFVQEARAQILKERKTALEQALTDAARPLGGVVKKVEQQVMVGPAADVLLTAAAKGDVGLIVVGARGVGTLQRLLLGSVSENVLRHADRPVLIVKGGTPIAGGRDADDWPAHTQLL